MDEDELCACWRMERFIAMGCPETEAAILAVNGNIDVGHVDRLAKLDCPWDLMARILA
jgi:hypothetical protein